MYSFSLVCVLIILYHTFQLENCPLDRKTFIVKQDEDYVVNRVITQGEVSTGNVNNLFKSCGSL